ncbi:MAG: VOC family protein [bacterium]|nr:VOC family protein [bacterium]
MEDSQPGSIVWHDLTVPNAEEVKNFYSAVIGWSARERDGDFEMTLPETDKAVSGVCYARGTNANLPPQWLLYVTVPSVPVACEQCVKLGGTIVDGPRRLGNNMFCVLKDPAGAHIALIEP